MRQIGLRTTPASGCFGDRQRRRLQQQLMAACTEGHNLVWFWAFRRCREHGMGEHGAARRRLWALIAAATEEAHRKCAWLGLACIDWYGLRIKGGREWLLAETVIGFVIEAMDEIVMVIGVGELK
ncbi:hypothetical protein M0R45_002820 [Rubus argutus]|uniref:Uncharacterized protein n=1 Tax=Rubus argutus TaxID=59490 RepID=A0AAW1VLY2_RUBAR